MKVELQCGDTITIPKGCRAIVKDRSVVIEEEFKNGDVLCSENGNTILIFKGKYEDNISHFHSHYSIINPANICWFPDENNSYWVTKAFHHATEKEKKLLFDKMKEQGLRWNAEEKKVEKIRWRAKNKESYYFLNTNLTEVSVIEANDAFDKELWDIFNYFRTSEQAEEAAKRIRKYCATTTRR